MKYSWRHSNRWLVGLIVAIALFFFASSRLRGEVAPEKPGFIVGVWSQPVAYFDAWKARGINTVVGHEPQSGKVSKADWEAAAAKAGLFFITLPGPDLAGEAKQPFRLAWMQADEPDTWRKPLADNGQPNPNIIQSGKLTGWTRPEVLKAVWDRCKAASPSTPVFCNFNAMAITPEAYIGGESHKPYLAYADWVCSDWYVVNWQKPDTFKAEAFCRLARWSGWKPQLLYIEASQTKGQKESVRPPTAAELTRHVQMARGLGAVGVIYFAHVMDGSLGWDLAKPRTSWDGTTPELVAAMTAANAWATGQSGSGPPATPAATQPSDLAAIGTDVKKLLSIIEKHFRND